MIITHLNGACEIIISNGVKILTDPWLVDGEYYGSWCTYPSVDDFDFSSLDDIDYIFISHIHPDHLSKLTLEKLNKNIPVLIHKFPTKFVKFNIEKLGFKVIELESNTRTHLENNVHINIIPAGFCNPALCSKSFGCGKMEVNFTSTTIDTLCVIDDGEYSILNVNDCPYEIAKHAIDKVKEQYNKIDLLVTGYTGASAFPHCFENYSDDEKVQKAKLQKQYYYESGLNFINHVAPKYFMPHAGTYVLGGELVEMEQYRAVNDILETKNQYNSDNLVDAEGFLLNMNESFDLETGKQTKPYKHFDNESKNKYLQEVLKYKTYEYEKDDKPTESHLKMLCSNAFERFEAKRKELNLFSDTLIYIPLTDECIAQLSFNGKGISFVYNSEPKDNFIMFKVKPKLLARLLKGPRYGHWNNAEIGCHINFYRSPDVYERGIHYCMNFLHE
tara:strand:+ start:1563 stop:2897 length:1335 start_codon:yes stop_codon:yes gene_type:complete